MKAKLGSIAFRGNKRKSFLGKCEVEKGFQILEETRENRDRIEFRRVSEVAQSGGS